MLDHNPSKHISLLEKLRFIDGHIKPKYVRYGDFEEEIMFMKSNVSPFETHLTLYGFALGYVLHRVEKVHTNLVCT